MAVGLSLEIYPTPKVIYISDKLAQIYIKIYSISQACDIFPDVHRMIEGQFAT